MQNKTNIRTDNVKTHIVVPNYCTLDLYQDCYEVTISFHITPACAGYLTGYITTPGAAYSCAERKDLFVRQGVDKRGKHEYYFTWNKFYKYNTLIWSSENVWFLHQVVADMKCLMRTAKISVLSKEINAIDEHR